MEIANLITFIGGGSLVAMLLTQLLKKALATVNDRYGALATQVVLFAVAGIIAGVVKASALLPTAWVTTAGAIFLGAMAIYEVLYKAVWLGAIKGKA